MIYGQLLTFIEKNSKLIKGMNEFQIHASNKCREKQG